eukprot:TRINITY_DN479_c0_g4_i1.p1 TRINITY_DN479_c0_g4~~TRINITY_DN479_c0_g4_i1.p1  ORF type:complete len:309 (+),score=96.49 TRINITY_DN479_c0_g4_i1:73-999(+)
MPAAKTMWVAAALAAACAAAEYPASYIRTLETRTRCTNLPEVAARLGFSNYSAGTVYPPYDTSKRPGGGYDTAFSKSNNCYVVFENPAARTQPTATIKYRLASLPAAAAAAANASGAVYMTHAHDCGVCSTLDQLGVYLAHADLTTPVRKCGELLFYDTLRKGWGTAKALQCLDDLGFADACKYIWLYNTAATKAACWEPCLAHLDSPNNDPTKAFYETNYGEPWSAAAPRGCKNTINGAPACEDFQWRDGPYRLNPCLQCDECRSGPVFQRYAGRTRRDSGLDSAINRPPSQIVNMTHYYGIPFTLE